MKDILTPGFSSVFLKGICSQYFASSFTKIHKYNFSLLNVNYFPPTHWNCGKVQNRAQKLGPKYFAQYISKRYTGRTEWVRCYLPAVPPACPVAPHFLQVAVGKRNPSYTEPLFVNSNCDIVRTFTLCNSSTYIWVWNLAPSARKPIRLLYVFGSVS
jgi:hypothetical protein